MEPNEGLIAILDALGAAGYELEKINSFLNSRQLVIDQLKDKATSIGIDVDKITTFTFNDTVLIVYRTERPVSFNDVQKFGELLRRFAIKSLDLGILFRGSLSIGKFYVDDDTNTVMGEAVSDAAAWYDSADWVGIAATPQATFLIQSLTEQDGENIERLMVDYLVPFKDGRSLPLKAINWPKAFFVRGMRPKTHRGKERAKCLSLLAKHGIPKGAESKHLNTIAFFDYCVELKNKKKN